MFNLFRTGGKLAFAAAVNYVNLFCTQTKRTSCRVHSNITATANRNLLCAVDGGLAVFTICLHKVDTGQKFVGGINALEVFALDAHKFGKTCARADKYSLEAFFLHKLVDRDHLTHNGVGANFNTQSLKGFDFLSNDCLGQTEFGNTVNQNAARNVECFENSYVVTLLCKVACTGETCRARADNRNLVTVAFGTGGKILTVCVVIIGNESFKSADCNRFALDAANTFAFTLGLLRANSAADSGERALTGDHVICTLEITFLNERQKFGDIDINRTACNTGTVFTAKATVCLVNCLLGGIAKSNLLEITRANFGCLMGHLVLFQRHISHFHFPPSVNLPAC